MGRARARPPEHARHCRCAANARAPRWRDARQTLEHLVGVRKTQLDIETYGTTEEIAVSIIGADGEELVGGEGENEIEGALLAFLERGDDPGRANRSWWRDG